MAAPRSLRTDDTPVVGSQKDDEATQPPRPTNSTIRRRRSMVISDRKVRSADVGVSGIYEVISEADLAFSPDSKPEAVTVFQGRIREEVVYGICLPVPGFSVLFILVAVSAVVSALVAGSLLYRYQLQREQLAHQAQNSGFMAMNSFANWVGLRFHRARTNTTENNNPKPSTSAKKDSRND